VSEDEARRRVRQLLLSGDNTLKNRTDDAARVGRARSRYEDALVVAREAGLDDAVVFAQRRLDALDQR
jgi:hypothetical protein